MTIKILDDSINPYVYNIITAKAFQIMSHKSDIITQKFDSFDHINYKTHLSLKRPQITNK